MWHSEQSHVYGDRVLSLFIEFGDELMSGECPGAGAAAERELCQWEGLNADNLRLSLGIIAGGDIFKVVPCSVGVRHTALILQKLHNDTLICVLIGEHLLIVGDLPQVTDILY